MGQDSRQRGAALMLLAVALIWGSGFIATQIALDAQMSFSFIMFVRFTVAALVMGAAFFRRLRSALRREHLAGGFVVGLFLFAAFYVQTAGLKYTTPSNNAFITASNVVMVPFLWWAVSRRRPAANVFAASFLCLAGVAVLSINWENGVSFAPGDLLTLLCAALFACQIVATGVFSLRMDAEVLVFLQLAAASLLSLAVFLLSGPDWSGFSSPGGMAAMLYLGVFSTCLCYFLQTRAQQSLPSSRTAIILSTESLFGTLFSVLCGYDRLSGRMIVGGVVVVASILITELPSPGRRQGGSGG